MKQLILTILIFSCTFFGMQGQDACSSVRYKQPIFKEVNVYENIAYARAMPYWKYGRAEKKDFHFDFYEPLNDEVEKRPLVLMFCGGDFQKGDKKDSEVKTWCDSLASYGFTCAAVNYRLGYNPKSGASVERAIYRSVQDVRAAIRYFKEFHNTFKIDTNQIYIGGDEAGAVAVLHAAFINEEKQRAKATYGITDENSDLGCLDCSGNVYAHSTDVAGLINMRGTISQMDLTTMRKKIPMIHIEDALKVASKADENPLVQLNMKSATALHDELDRLGYPSKKEDVAIFNSSGLTKSLQSTQIWNAVWQQIRSFLFETMSFTSPAPLGRLKACAGKTMTYKAKKMEGAKYCWQVLGGKIVASSGASVDVVWNYNREEGSIRVIVTNPAGVVGQPSALLTVNLQDVAVSDFAIQKIEENVIQVKDESSYGSFFTLDFGDESSPLSGKPGSIVFHTYDLKGDYTVTQVLENVCGTAISTQNISIDDIAVDAWEVLRSAVFTEKETFSPNEIVAIKLNPNIYYQDIKLDIIHEKGEKVFSRTVNLSATPAIEWAKNQLQKGKYTIQITADGNTVKKYFSVE